VTVCLAVLVIYYMLVTGGRTLGDRGKLAPWFAMWLPNLTLGAFSLFAFVRKNRETPLPLEEAIGRFLGRLRRLLPSSGSLP
jgi:lipopolysaccharide export system permease protein